MSADRSTAARLAPVTSPANLTRLRTPRPSASLARSRNGPDRGRCLPSGPPDDQLGVVYLGERAQDGFQASWPVLRGNRHQAVLCALCRALALSCRGEHAGVDAARHDLDRCLGHGEPGQLAGFLSGTCQHSVYLAADRSLEPDPANRYLLVPTQPSLRGAERPKVCTTGVSSRGRRLARPGRSSRRRHARCRAVSPASDRQGRRRTQACAWRVDRR